MPAEEPFEPTPSRGHPRLLEALEPRVAEALPDSRLVRVGEELDRGHGVVEGPGYTLTFEYRANPARERVWVRKPEVFEAVRYLRALAAAGVDLQRTRRRLASEQGPLTCWDEGAVETDVKCVVSPEPTTPPTTLEQPDYLEPPSRRSPTSAWVSPRTGSPVEVPAIAAVTARHPDFEVQGLPLDADHRALLVTKFEGPRVGAALCILESGHLQCAPTAIESLTGVLAMETDRWLLLGNSGFGNGAGTRERLLISLALTGVAPTIDILGIGAISVAGGACERRNCARIDAWPITANLVADGCVERRFEGRWSATHDRRDDRWIDEEITPREGGPCVDRFSYDHEGFERSECGPPSPTPACAPQEPQVREPIW